MTQFYLQEDKLYVSVDCIILGFKDNAIHVLIIKRKFEPLQGERSLMGGFVRENESLDETVSSGFSTEVPARSLELENSNNRQPYIYLKMPQLWYLYI